MKTKTKEGRVTRYGFMCGNVEEWWSKDDRYRITFSQDVTVWEVEAYDRNLNIRIDYSCWPIEKSIHYPRKYYDALVKGYGARLTKCEIIRETKEYYEQDPLGRRGLNLTGGCEYLTTEGKRCAVGRCLASPPPDIVNSTGQQLYQNLALYYILSQYDMLPQYRGHGELFWNELQCFHDGGHLWYADKISEEGLTRYQFLLNKYATAYDKTTGITGA